MTERILVIGVGRIGAVTAIGLAHLGHTVIGFDHHVGRLAALAAGELSEAEPGLRAALRSALRYRALEFTAQPEGRFDMAMLCVDSPAGSGGECDVSQVLGAARSAAGWLVDGGVLVTRSTIPVGTGDRVAAALAAEGRADVVVVHLPEFLREGHAWEDFRAPDRLVVGGDDAPARARVAALFAGIQTLVLELDRRSAEMAKYAANAFLATTISFANEIADLCAVTGASPADVFAAVKADSRIGPHAQLRPGLGFGGHCLPKDTAALEYLAATHGRSLIQLQATRMVNGGRVGRAVAALRDALGRLDGCTIAIAGLAFKPGTDDLRGSPSLALAQALRAEGAVIRGWDPLVVEPIPGIEPCRSLAEALDGSDALVLVNLPEDGAPAPSDLAIGTTCRVVLDPSGLIDITPWEAAGFRVAGGRSRHAATVGGDR